MAQMISVRLNKGEAPSLGFRIQGGKDFGTPLIIQKVNFGSPAEKAGLQAGDSLIKINNVDVFSLRHKDAQDVIIRAGPAFEMTVQRGGSTWKPAITPTTPTLPKPQPTSNSYSPVTKTSLAANPQPSIGAIGTGHNVSAKPFNAQLNGTVNGGPKFVNKQYNTPLGLYSEQSIAETLSAQAEVLSTGVLGVNFKKNEKNYDASNSEVFRMVQEADKEPKQEPEPDSGVVSTPLSSVIGLRHVSAPETKPTPPTPQLPPGQNICAECERLVTGVFVRIKDKNLHVECFKCATCGTSLKNVGYYNINNKLYCDIHAKLAARSNPPAPNVVPVTVPPGGRVPAGTISAALSSHPLPSSAAPLSPNPNQTAQPFQQSIDVTDEVSSTSNAMVASVNEMSDHDFTSTHVTKDNQTVEKPVSSVIGNVSKYNPIRNEGPISFSAYMSKSGTNFSSPRPFSSVSAPLSPPTNTGYSTLPKASPVSAPYSSPAPSVPSSERGRSLHNIIWPPPAHPEESDTPTATPLYFPPPSHLRVPTPPYKPPEPQIIRPPLPKASPSFQPVIKSSQREEEETAISTTEEVVYKEETVREETTTYSESVLTEEEEFLEAEDIMEPRMSLCSAEVTSIVDRRLAVETIESAAETQMLVESLVKRRPQSPPPVPRIDEDILPKVEVQTQPLRPGNVTEPRVVTRVCVCTNSCCNANTGELCESCPMRDLKRPNDFQKSKVSSVQNTIPKRFGSPIITGVSVTINNPGKIKESPKSLFSEIPTKKPTTALGSALATAPIQPFQPVSTTLQKISLPEETKPYLPPERPYVPPPKPERKEPIPPPDSAFISALRIAPERPWTPTNPPPLVTKKKQNEDPIMKDLPKPKQWMSMVTALTTAPERPYSPFIAESVSTTTQVIEQTEIQQQEIKKMKQSQQDIMRRSAHNETALPKPFIGTTTKATRLEKFEALNDDRITPQMHFPPISDELKASYEYRADYSEIKSEISSQIVEQAHLEEKSEVTQKVQQQKQKSVKCDSCQKAVTKEEKKIEKQTEETILKKPMELASHLQKREYLPQYQMSLNYDETIELPHHKNIKKLLPSDQGKQDVRNPNTKPSSYQYTPKPLPAYQEPQLVTKPVTTIQPGQTNPKIPAMSFQTIDDERPPRTSFSPRPGSLTPSMINKPPSVIPYYQENLVYTEMPVPEINIFDPKNPSVSRSPSPCPERAPSPFGRMSPRPRSPAAGPPPNPLKLGIIPKFTKEDHLRSEAKKNISTYIPQYMEKVEGRVSDSKTVTQHVSFDVPLKKAAVQESACMKKSDSKDCGASCTIKVAKDCGQASRQKMQSSHQREVQMSLQKSAHQTVQEIVQESVQTVQQSSTKQHSSATQQSSSKQASLDATKQTLKPSSEPPFRQVKNPEVDPPGVQEHAKTNLEITIVNGKPQNGTFTSQTTSPTTSAQSPVYSTKTPKSTSRQSSLDIREYIVASSKIPTPPPIISLNVHNDNIVPKQSQFNGVNGADEKPIQSSRDGAVSKLSDDMEEVNISKSSAIPFRKPYLVELDANPNDAHVPNSKGPNERVGKRPTSVLKDVLKNRIEHVQTEVDHHPKSKVETIAANTDVIHLDNNQTLTPICCVCNTEIARGPFITALGKIWCPEHFVCTTQTCKRALADIGFIEEQGQLYCEFCFEQYLAPPCGKCGIKIKGDCLKAIGKTFHPECFNCSYCGKLFGNSPFFLEDGQPYCENDWNEMFTTKCFACGFPVEAGDRWVEALNNNYHSQCFNCTMCKKNLEGQTFFAKGGRPFCKNHAR